MSEDEIQALCRDVPAFYRRMAVNRCRRAVRTGWHDPYLRKYKHRPSLPGDLWGYRFGSLEPEPLPAGREAAEPAPCPADPPPEAGTMTDGEIKTLVVQVGEKDQARADRIIRAAVAFGWVDIVVAPLVPPTDATDLWGRDPQGRVRALADVFE